MHIHLNKSGLRVLGIAESFQSAYPQSILAGVVMRADLRIDGLAYSQATVGGNDATNAMMHIYKQLDRRDINALLISGVVLSWFNIIDLERIFNEVNRPIICLTYEESPGLENHIKRHFPDSKEKLLNYICLEPREMVRLKTGYNVYVRTFGATAKEAQVMLNKFTLDGRMPEPLRVARLAARAALKRMGDCKRPDLS